MPGWEFTHSLNIAHFNERLWAHRSGRLWQKGDHEPSFRSLMSESLICSFAHKKTSDSLKKMWIKSNFLYIVKSFVCKFLKNSLIPSFLVSDVSDCSGRSPKMSEWANRWFFWAICSSAHFFAKKERFAQNTDERIPNLAKMKSYTWQITKILS